MSPEILKHSILEKIPDAQVEIVSADNVHYEASIISDSFAGLSPVKRQQWVYTALNPYIASGALHAIALKTLTHAELEGTRHHG